ncbi:MAG: hypothetical protein LBI13_04325 [Streptococcaceae bacterium]|jgi:hypothetical protein|nr:hypothetical protein [Streptococcaceae bacterium]
MSLSVQSYLSLGAILTSLIVIIFGARKYSKFVDNENFIFESYVGILGGAISSAIMVILPAVVILGSGAFLISSFGIPLETVQEQGRAFVWPFILCVSLPLLIMCIASALKTRRLAKSGHKLAGYLVYMINPRLNLLKLLYACFLVTLLFSAIFGVMTQPDFKGPPTIESRISGLIGIAVFIGYCIFVGYTDRILHFIMKRLLGKGLNLDYSPLIKRSEKEFGISEKEFYEKNFTSKELKWLEKEKEQNGK